MLLCKNCKHSHKRISATGWQSRTKSTFIFHSSYPFIQPFPFHTLSFLLLYLFLLCSLFSLPFILPIFQYFSFLSFPLSFLTWFWQMACAAQKNRCSGIGRDFSPRHSFLVRSEGHPPSCPTSIGGTCPRKYEVAQPTQLHIFPELRASWTNRHFSHTALNYSTQIHTH